MLYATYIYREAPQNHPRGVPLDRVAVREARSRERARDLLLQTRGRYACARA